MTGAGVRKTRVPRIKEKGRTDKHMNALHMEEEEAILEWLRKNNRKPVKEN